MQQKIVPIVSVVVGILAFLLTRQYLNRQYERLRRLEDEIYAGAQKIEVVVARRNIPGGTTIKKTDLGKKSWFKSQLPDRVVQVEEAALIIDRKTVFPITAEKPILWSDIEGGQPREDGLADIVTPGLRAVSISVGGAAAVSTMVLPNDRVDVLGTFSFAVEDAAEEMETVTLTVLQDVTVLATGQQTAKQLLGRRTRRQTGYNTVTLEVTAREAELLVFAQQIRGRLYLSLRHPSDVSYQTDLPSVNFEHLEHKLPELNLIRQRDIRNRKDL